MEHNEISSIPHLRLLGARVNHGDSSRHENVPTVNSSLPDVLEEDVKDFQKEDESFDNKEEIKRDGEKGNAKELNLDEVDDMLSRNLVSDEHGEEKKRPELKPRSSTLTEDPSLLGIDHYSEVHQTFYSCSFMHDGGSEQNRSEISNKCKCRTYAFFELSQLKREKKAPKSPLLDAEGYIFHVFLLGKIFHCFIVFIFIVFLAKKLRFWRKVYEKRLH